MSNANPSKADKFQIWYLSFDIWIFHYRLLPNPCSFRSFTAKDTSEDYQGIESSWSNMWKLVNFYHMGRWIVKETGSRVGAYSNTPLLWKEKRRSRPSLSLGQWAAQEKLRSQKPCSPTSLTLLPSRSPSRTWEQRSLTGMRRSWCRVKIPIASRWAELPRWSG